jgi:2-polyprenyl-6-methoxyphenol hydroxylase-like FAD-dependent oxidoreductase
MKAGWDVIIIGARIAGSTLASYLGRAGLRVLLVDRAHFPADIPQQAAWEIKANRLWDELGVLTAIEATNAPRQTGHYFVTDDIVVPYSYADIDKHAFRMTVRRVKLDAILSQYAASFPSVELRTGFPVNRLLWEGESVSGIAGGREANTFTETAPLIVGADGQYSWLRRQVGAVQYEEIHSQWASYFGHFSNTNAEPTMGHYVRTADSFYVAGTSDENLLTASISIQRETLDSFRRGLPHSFEKRLRGHSHINDVLGNGKLEGSVNGACHLRMFKHKPYGPGWALVGDAGYHLDPMSAKGVTAAIVSARLLSNAICSAFQGDMSMESALEQYHQERDKQLTREWNVTYRTITKEAPDEERHMRARLLANEPDLCHMQMLAQFGYIPMAEFRQKVTNVLKERTRVSELASGRGHDHTRGNVL